MYIFDYQIRSGEEKNANLFQHEGHTNKMDSGYLENYVCICAPVNDLDQAAAFYKFDSFGIMNVKNTTSRWPDAF